MRRALGLVAAGLGLSAASALLWPEALPHAWLAAAVTLLAWPLGSLALLMIHGVTGGRWGEAVRGPLLLGVASLPLALLALVPVGLSAGALYPWLGAAHLANEFYLNAPFMAGRFALYAVVWLALAGFAGSGGMRRFAPVGLILLAFTASFASIDLTMSLDPGFVSSVYPMLSGTGSVLFALSVALLLAVPGASGRGRDDLGKLLLAVCLLWAYLDFIQFLVIWTANLEQDASWMRRRVDGFWGWVFGVEAALHAVLPLFVLAIPQVRRRNGAVMGLAAALAVGGAVRNWWLVLPEAGRVPGWADAGCLAGLALVALGLGLAMAAPVRRRAAHA